MKYLAILGLVVGMGGGLSQTDAQASSTSSGGPLLPLVVKEGQPTAQLQDVWWHRHWRRHWHRC